MTGSKKPALKIVRVDIASVWEDILSHLEEGKTLREVCNLPGVPSWEGLRKFIRADSARVAQYAHARAVGAEALEDELLHAARSAGPEDANARRLQVDALKWVMSKRAPKVYGDKITQEHTGPDGGPVQVSEVRRVIVRPPDKKE
ncbi:MAG: hypothetical protein ABF785_04485 [Acetobacter papayae]|uniref:terminase small subunit-like protein n=1 Tax=Acetobacter papayae TaxID=1076592 RepID=UPI0039ECAACA